MFYSCVFNLSVGIDIQPSGHIHIDTDGVDYRKNADVSLREVILSMIYDLYILVKENNSQKWWGNGGLGTRDSQLGMEGSPPLLQPGESDSQLITFYNGHNARFQCYQTCVPPAGCLCVPDVTLYPAEICGCRVPQGRPSDQFKHIHFTLLSWST